MSQKHSFRQSPQFVPWALTPDNHTPETFPNLMDSTGHFNEAILKYRAGEWDKSKKKFTEALAANPNDDLAKIYIERCQQLKVNPPKSWNGIWVMTSK